MRKLFVLAVMAAVVAMLSVLPGATAEASSGDAYADEVDSFTAGDGNISGDDSDGGIDALGPEEWMPGETGYPFQFTSLGFDTYGGVLILNFTDNVCLNGTGDDIHVFDAGDNESADISVGLIGGSLTSIGSVSPGGYTLDAGGLSVFNQVRIEATDFAGTPTVTGFDVDAVECLNSGTLVDDDLTECPGAAYTVIQDAVDAASSGDTIVVCAGEYNESVVISTDDLTLTGLPGAILDGGDASLDAFTLADGLDGLTIEGFEIRDYGADAFTQPGNAIVAWDVSTSNVTIRNNYMHGFSWNAVLVGSEGGFVHDSWMVKNNVVTDAAFVGIELTNCNGCTIMKNDIDPTSYGIVIQARNSVAGSGSVAIDGVNVLHNTVDNTSGVGIYVLSFTGHPTLYTPIAGASTLLSSVNIKNNTVTDSGSAAIRFWAYNNAATAINGRIIKNTINCLSSTPGIQVLERGSGGQTGTVENVKVVNNTLDNDCSPAYTDEGDDTKLPPGLGPYGLP